MIKGFCLAALILLIGSSMVSIASSQDQVSQTVYVHEGDLNGTLLSGVQVVGQDAAGISFQAMTDSNGIVVVNGQPGTWQFVFIKEGYETLGLSYNVTETDEGAVYLVRSDLTNEQIASSPNNLQHEAISESAAANRMQLGTNATPLEVPESYQERERLNSTVSQKENGIISTASSQDQVSQTVYVHEGDLNGTLLSGVQVVGQDAAGISFQATTDSNGIVVVNGQPGSWQFVFTKEGYETLKLSYDVTETGEGAVYIVKSDQPFKQIAISPNNPQHEATSESTTTDRTQLGSNETPLGVPESYQAQERLNPIASQKIETTEPETANTEFWLEKGNALYEQGRYNEAVQAYNRAIMLNPQLEAAWFNKGNALYMQGDYDEALRIFDRAIEINPQDAIAWNCRGLTLIKLGYTVKANAAFIRGKELGYMG